MVVLLLLVLLVPLFLLLPLACFSSLFGSAGAATGMVEAECDWVVAPVQVKAQVQTLKM